MPTHSPSLASRRSLEEETKCEGAKAANATAHGGEFPEDLFTAEEKKNGWVVLHIIGMIYMFVGLAVVCDDYFESSLQSISDALELSPDVAGATFMAAGSSAPELFTSLMGVFVATSDIGVGTIVGSAVFNVLIIIAMVCFAAPNVSLDWYPLTRDCIFYCLSIIALVATIFDQKVSWYESVVLFLLYFVYVYIMKRNSEIQEWMVRHANEPHVPTQLQTRVMKVCEHWTFNWFIYSVIIINITIVGLDLTDPQDWQKMVNHIFSGIFIAEMGVKIYGFGFFNYWREALNAFDGILVFMIVLELCLSGSGMAGGVRGLRLFRVFRALRGLRIVKLYRAFHRTYADDETQTDMQDLRLASFHGIKGTSVAMF